MSPAEAAAMAEAIVRKGELADPVFPAAPIALVNVSPVVLTSFTYHVVCADNAAENVSNKESRLAFRNRACDTPFTGLELVELKRVSIGEDVWLAISVTHIG